MRETGAISDLRQSPGWTKFMSKIGWHVDYIGSLTVFSKQIPVLGTVIRIPRPNLPLPLEEIDLLAREKKAALVKIEPNLLSPKFNPNVMGTFHKAGSPVLPTRSIWIDLTKSNDQLSASLEKDTRNLVRKAAKDNVLIAESNNLKNFYSMWADNAKKKGFYTPFEKELSSLWKSFNEKHILVAKYHDRTVAAALLLGHKEAIYYSFASSTDEGRGVHASYLLLWEAIVNSKKWGYDRLDLEGISDPRVGRTKSWEGFTHFKKGFGGQSVDYIGSFSKYYSPLGKLIGRFL